MLIMIILIRTIKMMMMMMMIGMKCTNNTIKHNTKNQLNKIISSIINEFYWVIKQKWQNQEKSLFTIDDFYY